jgi:hypothetical protein
MSTRADVEELEVTRTEKLLALVLTVFLLIAGIWVYTRVDDVIRHHVPVPRAALTANPAVARESHAQRRVFAAEERSRTALQTLELRREAYRTALDANKPAAALERRYNAAQAAYAASQRELAAARRQLSAASPAANAVRRTADARIQAALHRQERDAFVLRLGLVLLSIALAYWLLSALRKRRTRWFPLAGSVVVFATIFALVLAADYLTDYLDPFQWGVAVVAVFGIATTLFAYLLLQRHLIRRVPQRRVRRRECPFCGYPLSANTHCEGCGREVVAACARCDAPRRVGTLHCGACGATS